MSGNHNANQRPTSAEYAMGYAEGFNDACKPKVQPDADVATNALHITDFIKPGHTTRFNTQAGSILAELNFNGPQMTFTGDAAEAAKVFIDWVSHYFNQRLQDERDKEREECAKVCDDIDADYEGEDVSATWCAEAIRARGNT